MHAYNGMITFQLETTPLFTLEGTNGRMQVISQC